MSRLVDQIKQALAAFAVCGTAPALIGGLALAALEGVRGMRDMEFLVDSDDADRVDEALAALGYRCIQRSADAANYTRGDECLALIYAHRPVARRPLRTALELEMAMGRLRVVSDWSCSMSCLPKSATAPAERRAEGLVGRDVASTSMPAGSDLSDWIELMEAIETLCPVWPEHQPRKAGGFKL